MTVNRHVKIADIEKNPFQVRSSVDPVYVEELAEDIERNGLLQAPMGRILINEEEGQPQKVQLAFGHNRLEAFRLLGEKFSEFGEMPVVIRELTDEQMALMAWSENEVRQQLNPVERSLAVKRMMETFGWSQQEAGDRLGMARSTVANLLRLLNLPETALNNLSNGVLSVRQAMALLPIYDLDIEDQDWIWRDPLRSMYLTRAMSGETGSNLIRDLVSGFLEKLAGYKDELKAKEDTVEKANAVHPDGGDGGEADGKGRTPMEGTKEVEAEKDKLRRLIDPAIDFVSDHRSVTVPQLQHGLRISWIQAVHLVKELQKWDVLGEQEGLNYPVLVGKYAEEAVDEGGRDEGDKRADAAQPMIDVTADIKALVAAPAQTVGSPEEEELKVEIIWKEEQVEVMVTICYRDGTTNSVLRTRDRLPLYSTAFVLLDAIPVGWRGLIK